MRKVHGRRVDASLQWSVCNYAVGLSRFAEGGDVGLRVAVQTRAKQRRSASTWSTRGRAANVPLPAGRRGLRAVEVGLFTRWSAGTARSAKMLG